MKTHRALFILLVSFTLVSCQGGKSTSTSSGGNKIVAPTTASKLTATLKGSKVHLSWDAVSTATYYQIYKSDKNTPSTATKIVDSLASATTSYSDSISVGMSYYWLKACNTGGCSSFSAVVKLGPPTSAPVLMDRTTDIAVGLTWEAIDSAEYYEIYRGTTNDSSSSMIISRVVQQ